MSTKAAGYIVQLDIARCEGNWDAVPELVRKVRKHGPNRACLTLTAETECAISKTTNAVVAAGGNPTVDASTATTNYLDIADQLPKLIAASEGEAQHPEDKFQAQVCAGWLHWVLAEYTLCLNHLPKGLDEDDAPLDPTGNLSEWTVVCALKSAYLKANCLTRNSEKANAIKQYETGLSCLNRVWSGQPVGKQLRYWAELFLTEYCMLTTEAIQQGDMSLQDPNSVAGFRAWSRYWDAISAPLTGGVGFKGSVPRRKVWNEYYLVLSEILENDLPFPSGNVGKITNETSARNQLRVELKHAEAAYQALLVAETPFPRAVDERTEVEDFVKLVVKNWTILCGRGWREQDLGEGGRIGISRGVLDILYNAATRTYHSTVILRFLFTVHLSVAEFDLAVKAFDSYMEIVKKGKARVDKTGHPEPSLDDDGTVLATMAQSITSLCQYGHRAAIEKARKLAGELEDWMAKLPQIQLLDNATPAISEAAQASTLHPPVAPHVTALAWQAIGLAHAHWSRVTYEAASRTEIQSKAVRCLRRSLATEYGRTKDIRTYYGLALLLAERRDLTAAIEVTKTALTVSKGHEAAYNLHQGSYWQERSLIPVWHLLALLLSARQDYIMASRACEGALEQFKDPSVLFGKAEPGFRSEHLNDIESKSKSDSQRGIVDEMDDGEKESILEVKMTQLALVELLEGPDVAVNASYELLTLFSRLFGTITAQPTLEAPTVLEPPKTSATFRTIKGSIFGSKDRGRPPTRQPNNMLGDQSSSTLPSRPMTAQSQASTIQVTQEKVEDQGRPRTSASARRRRSASSGRRNSLKKPDDSASRQRASSVGKTAPHRTTVVDDELFFTPAQEGEQTDFSTYSSKRRSSSRSSSFSRNKPLTHLNSYMSTASRTTDHSELSVDGTYASTDLLPVIQFSKEKEKTRRTAILIKVWLMIAGFYRRASMLDDAKGAVEEAQKLVQTLESEAAREPVVANTVSESDAWAEKRSVDNLWGDVWSEMGTLAVANGKPYVARAEFESALTHSPNHPIAIVGLSNILLDIYSQDLLPPAPMAALEGQVSAASAAKAPDQGNEALAVKSLPTTPLGLGSSLKASPTAPVSSETSSSDDQLPTAYKATCLPLVDRLAARDRAYALLSGLTKLGEGWNMSEAWFTLARAYEESGQAEKAKEVLWWCVELEEGAGVRDWASLSGGRYII